MRKSISIFVLTLILVCLSNPAFAWTERYANCGLGTGDSDGTTEANAWKTVQEAFDEVAAGERINLIDSTTCTLAATIDINVTDGTIDTPIMLQGYTSSIDDGGRAVIDGNSTAASIFNVVKDYQMFKDLELKGSSAAAIIGDTNGDYITFENVKITSSGAEGFDVDDTAANYWWIINCEITGTTTEGMDINSIFYVFYNNIHDTGTHNIQADQGFGFIVGNILDTTTNGYNYLQNTADHNNIIGNTMYNAVGAGNDNLRIFSNDEHHVIINNIFNTAANYNVEISTGTSTRIYGYNNLSAGTTGTIQNGGTIHLDLGGANTDDPQFTNAPNRDFNIGANLDNAGFPTTVLGSTDTTYNKEIGSIMYEEEGAVTRRIWLSEGNLNELLKNIN